MPTTPNPVPRQDPDTLPGGAANATSVADPTIGEKYWNDTLHNSAGMLARGMGSEGGADEPPKFKHYPTAERVALPSDVPLRIGSVEGAFTGQVTPRHDLDDGQRLAALLHYSFGLSRVDVGPISGWPFHRLVASARCFYPTELYVHLTGHRGAPDGVYHYDPAHHALIRVRPGDHLAAVAAATAANLDGATAVVVVTSNLWKTAFRYRHYAYRLCTQEAGMVTANVLRVARTLGLTGHLHYWFADETMDRLVGATPGEERTMAVLPLYPASDAPTAPLPKELPTPDLEPIHLEYLDVPKDLALAADTYTVDADSVLAPRDVARSRPRTTARRDTRPQPAQEESTPRGHHPLTLDLADALRGRTSGGTVFRPAGHAAPRGALTRIAHLVGRPYPSDLGEMPLAHMRLIVQRDQELDAGIYECAHALPSLRRIGSLPEGRLDRHIVTGPPVVDLTATTAVAAVITDQAHATARLGTRGYRIANMDAGMLAHELGVLASAAGLASRPFNGYSVPGTKEVLGVTDPDLTPLFQVALGRRVASAQYEMPIIF